MKTPDHASFTAAWRRFTAVWNRWQPRLTISRKKLCLHQYYKKACRNVMTLRFIVIMVTCLGIFTRTDVLADTNNPTHNMSDMVLYIKYLQGLREFGDHKTFAAKKLKEYKAKINATNLLEWAQRQINVATETTNSFVLSHTNVPLFVRNLESGVHPVVIIKPKSHIMIDWGGGWGHWGIAVGNDSYGKGEEDLLYTLKWTEKVCIYKTIK